MTVRRKGLRPATAALRRFLLEASDFDMLNRLGESDPTFDRDEAREYWEAHRGELLAAYQPPNTTAPPYPLGWYLFEEDA